VQLGSNCIIYQNVTIGTKETKDYVNAAYPVLGSNVIVYANSVIFGDIEIGDNVIIGAGSIVFKSIPANSVVGGNPGKILNK
jgi:serine O-acetyltransferase